MLEFHWIGSLFKFRSSTETISLLLLREISSGGRWGDEEFNSPFNASVSFGTAVEILELALDGVLLTHSFFRELHERRIKRTGEFSVAAMIAISTDYD